MITINKMDNSGLLTLYKALGLNVVPASPNSKQPSLKWKEFQTKKYEGDIPKDYNLAVICGKISNGLVVIDIDAPELLDQMFEDVERLKKKTMVIQTGSGGYHIYVKPKSGSQDSMRLDNDKGQHIDIQSDGTIVIIPPSIHPNGERYRIISEVNQIEEIDLEGFIKSLTRLGFNPAERKKPIMEIRDGVTKGNRNYSGFRYAMYLRRFWELDGSAILQELIKWNKKNDPPLTDNEVDSITNSCLSYDVESKVDKQYSLEDFDTNNYIYGSKEFWNEMRRKANATSLDPSDIPIYCNQCKMKCKADAQDNTHQGHKVRLNKGTTK